MPNLLTCLCLLCFQNADVTLEERFRVQYVLLDVAAHDKRGTPIPDLKASDFEVRENGKKVAVNFFDVLDYRDAGAALPVDGEVAETPVAPADPTPSRPVRQIIIALDLESTGVQEAKKAIGQLREFLTGLEPAIDYRINLYSLAFGSATNGFQDRTDEVLAALNRLEDRHFNDKLGGHNRSDTLLKDRDRPARMAGETVRPGGGGRMLGTVN